ncbi:putative bifunctional diguanylate cyclase/phosphodiesterase [Microvirga soli]|uniref:putative bifunctional diguanylate cyclase/phosphodiesterase n=1 Tax=Microvirga soli TaxID=1854496 RepID=UPI00191E9ADB|nr:GGDEF and EAL domain-containing protein [Microvirga soli]
MSGTANASHGPAREPNARQPVALSPQALTTLLNNVPGVIYTADPTSPWSPILISDGAKDLTGYAADDFTSGRIAWAGITHPEDLDKLQRAVQRAYESRHLFAVDYRIRTRDGGVRWVLNRGRFVCDPTGEPVSLEGFVTDLTEQRQAEARAKWVMFHDTLTQLPNRELFQTALRTAVAQGDQDAGIGLLLLDLDHLKQVNDTVGYDAGDLVLRTTAHRLRTLFENTDAVARIGGDEFAIILPRVTSEQDLKAVAQTLLERLAEPFSCKGQMLDCCASIGASLLPAHAHDTTDLLRQAGIALDVAKAKGRSATVMYAPAMRADVEHRATMLSNARGAITERRITPYYQPKVCLRSGRLTGFEALLRWRNPQGHVEAPVSLQAAFEDARLASGIGRQVLAAVIEDMQAWLEAGVDFSHVAINAAPAEFRSGRFAEQVLEGLRTAGVPTRCLEIEVTESVFLGHSADDIVRALETLSSAGVRIALDDFGTGHASFLHLRQNPVDVIKIDRSFIRNLPSSSEDVAILAALLDLGKKLGLTTVAEGIETPVQAEYLRMAGCGQGQGYLFGKPAPRSSVVNLIASWAPPVALSRPRRSGFL